MAEFWCKNRQNLFNGNRPATILVDRTVSKDVHQEWDRVNHILIRNCRDLKSEPKWHEHFEP